MAGRVTKLLSAVPGFLSRLWPVSKNGETLLEESGERHRADSQEEEPPSDGHR